MNLDQITTKCWILALFIRDDGERLLLGDGWFDFKDSLQHFQPNSIANDIVELQGTDGQLLAGQVRRSAAQSFDGYIGDALTNKTEIENRRRQFIQFFRTRRHYKVIYIFPDGTAIQRRMGYLTDAPSVPEMWQKFPEYHVALNFEDVNYYEYAEDAQGDEIYAHDSLVKLISVQSGGLIWDEIGAVSHGYTWLDPQTVTGDYITVTNGAAGSPLTLSQLTGNATQQTYSGKNLARPNANDTLAGVSIVWNSDGTVTLNGTATNAVDVWLANGGSGATEFTIPTGTKLTQSFRVVSGSASANTWAVRTILYYDGSAHWADVIGNTTFTASSETQVRGLEVLAPSGLTFNNLRLEIQLEESATATTWEPYVGGTASPNPDYPQAIEVVTGEQTVKVVGKNLFDMGTLEQGTINGSDGQDGPVNNTRIRTDGYITVLPNTTYTLNAEMTGDSPKGWVFLYEKYGTFKRRVPNVFVALPYTFTTGASEEKIRIIFATNSTTGTISPSSLENAQLELGSQATAYEPYQSQSHEANLGKNLSPYDQQLNLTWGNTNTDMQNLLNTLSPGTYTFSCKFKLTERNDTTDASKYGWYFVYDGGGFISRPEWGSATVGTEVPYSLTFTITDAIVGNFTRVYVYGCGVTGATGKADATEIQIEKGSTATAYAPYFTPIELCKIGTYQDRIYKEGEKWYVEKQVGKLIFDGTENWTAGTGGTLRLFYGAQYSDVLPSNQRQDFLSNNFHFIASGNETGAGFIYQQRFYFYYGNMGTDANAFKSWLTTHPTTVYYALATPTDTEITDETLLAQLNFVASLYSGVNNISLVPSAGAQGTMTLNYYADVDTTGAGYEWEAGEGGGPTIVQVIGVDNAQPIWTVTGPATNPTLTNITTVQTITWNGTVPNGQKLIIDMANQTATLAGANVYEFITGSWITLRPGSNKLTYSAQGADQASQIQWNGVVG